MVEEKNYLTVLWDVVKATVVVLVLLAFLALAIQPIERFWFHEPEEEARVAVLGEFRGRWTKPSSPVVEATTFQYLVEMPDGSHEIISLPARAKPGDHLFVRFFRGSLTGRVSIVSIQEDRPPE